jgi:hypothetical protein
MGIRLLKDKLKLQLDSYRRHLSPFLSGILKQDKYQRAARQPLGKLPTVVHMFIILNNANQ